MVAACKICWFARNGRTLACVAKVKGDQGACVIIPAGLVFSLARSVR
jgi:hypothetical protein